MVAEGVGAYTLPGFVCNHYLCYLSLGKINRLLLLLLLLLLLKENVGTFLAHMRMGLS